MKNTKICIMGILHTLIININKKISYHNKYEQDNIILYILFMVDIEIIFLNATYQLHVENIMNYATP
jgi:hypothetical protein